jgi:predicted nucleic acid-binding protein/5-methylcytosine-specific restriction endonuclease McrA
MVGLSVIETEADGSAWVRAHEALSRLAKARALADAEEGRWLLAALRSAAHVHLGFGTFGEYIERLFGYGRRCTQEKLRVAEALEGLPVLARALEEGAVTWCALRELTRVATRETERAWLEVARAKTVRQLEDLVAGKRPGDTPASPPGPSTRRHVLRFEVEPDTFALFREAAAELRRRSGSALSDDAVLLEMARHVLGGPQDEGRASYQIAVTVCRGCGGGTQEANGDVVAVNPEIVAMAHCDGQHIGEVGSAEQPEEREARAHVGVRAKQNIPPAVRRTVLRRDRHCCRVPGCRNATFVDVHHVELRAEGGHNDADNLLTVCALCRARHKPRYAA